MTQIQGQLLSVIAVFCLFCAISIWWRLKLENILQRKFHCWEYLSCKCVLFGRSCWFHGATAICRRPLRRAGATHVKLVQCLNPAYTYTPNAGQSSVQFSERHVIGGLFIGGIGDVYHCIKSCTGSCKAVDFDTADNRWLDRFFLYRSSCMMHSVCVELLATILLSPLWVASFTPATAAHCFN